MSLVNGRQVKFGGNFTSVRDYADKVIVKAIPFVETQTLTLTADQYALVDESILSGIISIGTTTTANGGVVAGSLPGAVGTASIVTIGDTLGNLTNVVEIRDATTHDPISVSDRQVFGLIQAASTVVDGDPIGAAASENLQMSFAYVAADGTLTLTAVTATIEFQINKAFQNSELPTYEFQGGNVAPDIVSATPAAQKIATYLVTTAFAANEVITLTSGAGSSGVATPGGDYAAIALGGNSGAFNANNKISVLENGVKQVKGTDFIYDSTTSGHFAIVLDIGDYFEVTYFA